MADRIISKAPPPPNWPFKEKPFSLSQEQRMPRLDFARLLKKDLWFLEEAIGALLGVGNIPTPPATELEREKSRIYIEILEATHASFIAGNLKCYDVPGTGVYVRPSEFIAWARSKDFPIPAELEGIQPVSRPAAKPKPSGEPIRLAEAARMIATALHGDTKTPAFINTANRHFWNFQNEAQAGRLRFIDKYHSPTGFGDDARLTPDEFEKYLVRHGIPYQTENSTPVIPRDQERLNQPVTRERVDVRRDKLSVLLDEIEARAAQAGIPFARHEFPGTKQVLRDFIKKWDAALYYHLPTDIDRFGDQMKPLGVRFLPGNNKGKGNRFFKTLFPELP